jgi:hypothetical protein
MAAQLDVLLREGQRLPLGNVNLEMDEVVAGDQFCISMK